MVGGGGTVVSFSSSLSMYSMGRVRFGGIACSKVGRRDGVGGGVLSNR
jgi:hypothetical protein